jgi:stearoyl-CoA desaturase (delta-9 desaturase)
MKLGLTLMGLADVILFGIVPGALIFLMQIVWIPFWAAGVINGIGHYWGYRNSSTPDASTNIVPWGILIGGEELHNNHHAFTTSAKLSNKWYEFDIGWMYIRILEALGLAKVKRVAPVPRFAAPRLIPNLQMLQAVITHRYDVQARYGKTLKEVGAEGREAQVLQTMHTMGRELMTLWERSAASKEQLVRRLQDWCRRAEASGIRPLVEFSRLLRCYA